MIKLDQWILRDFVGTPAANFADPGIWHTVEIKQVPQGRIITFCLQLRPFSFLLLLRLLLKILQATVKIGLPLEHAVFVILKKYLAMQFTRLNIMIMKYSA